MAEKNTLSILESIKQKMMKFEQDPEKNERIFDEIKEFEYFEPAKNDVEEHDKDDVNFQTDNAKIIADNVEDEEDTKFDLDLEDYEGEEEDLFQDNSNFLFENHDDTEQKTSQDFQTNKPTDGKSTQQTTVNSDNNHKINTSTLDDEFDLDELEAEFLKHNETSNVQQSKIQNQQSSKVEEVQKDDDDFLDDDFLDLEEDNVDLQENPVVEKPSENAVTQKVEVKNNEIDFSNLTQNNAVKEDNKAAITDAFQMQNDITSEDDDFDLDADFDDSKEEEDVEEKSLPISDNSTSENDLDFEDDDDDDIFEEESKIQQDVKVDSVNNTTLLQKEEQSKALSDNNKVEVIINKSDQNLYSMPLITKQTLQQSTESIRKLMDASNVVSGIKTFSQQAPFSEIALQLMEPKLEKWLNDHLPELVEKIVREEIARIVPKHEEGKK